MTFYLQRMIRIRIWILIQIRRILVFLGLPNQHPDPLVRDGSEDPDPHPDLHQSWGVVENPKIFISRSIPVLQHDYLAISIKGSPGLTDVLV
jgi:hypothetical protein